MSSVGILPADIVFDFPSNIHADIGQQLQSEIEKKTGDIFLNQRKVTIATVGIAESNLVIQ